MCRLKLSVLGVALLGLWILTTDELCAQPSPADNTAQTEVINGYRVDGYADGKVIGTQWYPTPEEAEAEKAKMEQMTVLTKDGGTAKYYDEVKIEREKREVTKTPGTSRTPPPNASIPPTGPRPGGAGKPAAPTQQPVPGSWTGSESASDTNSLRFVFKEPNKVTAYDDTGVTWSGTWRMISATTIVIQLTSPHEVNYSGQIKGDTISGRAGRPGGKQWDWKVKKQPK